MGIETQVMPGPGGESQTPPSLIRDMRAGDITAYERFYKKYATWLCCVFAGYGLGPEDAEDLTTNLTINLIERFKTSRYDPRRRFRYYLEGVAKNAVVDFWRKNGKVRTVGGHALDEVASDADFTAQILDRLVLLEAIENVRERKRVTAHDFEIFELLTERGYAPCDVAQRLNISRGAVDSAKNRVVKALRAEVARLS